ncbi:MAG TPA: DinB family protein [Candidatus Sulfotelmatobacter sp.]|jgi:uncharacterized damage-inducible protein DinB|nr:DinB family protein [Candidatus Sulfotelmatobacter sp.]
MDVLKHLQRQFDYDAWANGEVLAAIKASETGSDPRQSLKLLAHILSAERLWLERLRQIPQSLPVWPELTFENCQAQIIELAALWSEYLSQVSDALLSEEITYKNSKGESWTSSVQDVLTHVVMHSAYHRGQIASAMRAGGGTPASTDFIHAVRLGLIE